MLLDLTPGPRTHARRGWGELISETVLFARRAAAMAETWQKGENAVENIATEIRKIPGFGGKGFRILALRTCKGSWVQ